MRGTSAPSAGAKVRLARDVYHRLVRAHGAHTIDQQVALTGVPRRSLYRILQGREPSLGNALRMAEALDVTLEALFERADDGERAA